VSLWCERFVLSENFGVNDEAFLSCGRQSTSRHGP
jgi:hypothetical protein